MNHIIKMLIVEDETNIRNLIQVLVDWKDLGIEIVGEASTGLEAVDMAETLMPDIVLTDIEMPYMNGLALSKRLLSCYGDIAIVILTAHSDFAYAQQALKIGVCDYILKPVDRENLVKTIGEIADGIRKRHQQLLPTDLVDIYAQPDSLLFGSQSDPIDWRLHLKEIPLQENEPTTLALVSVAVYDGAGQRAVYPYKILQNYRAYIEKYFTADGRLTVLEDGLNKLIMISQRDNVDLSGVCRRLAKMTIPDRQVKVYYGISDPISSVAGLPGAYTQALDSLRLVLISNDEYALDEYAQSNTRIEDLVSSLLLFIKSGMCDRATAAAHTLFRRTTVSNGGDLNAQKLYVLSMLARAMETLAAQSIPWISLTTLITPLYPKVLSAKNLPVLEQLFAEQITTLTEYTNEHNSQRTSEAVTKALRDLEANYADPEQSLSGLARRHGLNSSYLSRSFKAYAGKTFSEYLMEMRIQKACEMLAAGDYRAHQLALAVGIPDPNYFTKCFKKVTGASFQAYKAKMAQKGRHHA